ncbi:uncharacterized protein LOC144659459 [Oculina patagonica]
MEQDSGCRTLELVRGLKCFSDTSPTVRIEGDCWPPYGEVVTRFPLCGSSELNVFVDCIEGQANLTFGLIFPYERRRQTGARTRLWITAVIEPLKAPRGHVARRATCVAEDPRRLGVGRADA